MQRDAAKARLPQLRVVVGDHEVGCQDLICIVIYAVAHLAADEEDGAVLMAMLILSLMLLIMVVAASVVARSFSV